MSHITQEQRYVTECLKNEGKSLRCIGAIIGKSASSICKELKRNCDRRKGEYRAELAQRHSIKRRKSKPHSVTFTEEMKSRVAGLIERKFSPEVDARERLGDMEIDLMVGARHKGALVTINDRTAGTVHIRKVETKEAKAVAEAAIDALTPL
jgi:IS30 family transposase